MAIKRKDFQKTSSIILEFLLKLPDEETSSRLRDTLLHGLHFLQQYYLILQKRDKEQKPLQWTIERGLSPLTPFREAPDKFEWPWIDVESNKVKQTLPRHSINNFVNLPPIIVAVREGDLRYVKELLNSDPDLIDRVDSFGRDLLTYAVQYQQIHILRYLLLECNPSANINTQANDGSTCLHRACYNDDGQQCNIDIVRLLLENNADVTKQDVHLRSPLHEIHFNIMLTNPILLYFSRFSLSVDLNPLFYPLIAFLFSEIFFCIQYSNSCLVLLTISILSCKVTLVKTRHVTILK